MVLVTSKYGENFTNIRLIKMFIQKLKSRGKM